MVLRLKPYLYAKDFSIGNFEYLSSPLLSRNLFVEELEYHLSLVLYLWVDNSIFLHEFNDTSYLDEEIDFYMDIPNT